jgi:hypothetical protein
MLSVDDTCQGVADKMYVFWQLPMQNDTNNDIT